MSRKIVLCLLGILVALVGCQGGSLPPIVINFPGASPSPHDGQVPPTPASPAASPEPTCPPGQNFVFEAGDTEGHCEGPPPPDDPVRCQFPQPGNDNWELVNFGCRIGGACPNPDAKYGPEDGDLNGTPVPESAVLDPAAALRFPYAAIKEALYEEITAQSGCAFKQNPCPTRLGYQEAHSTMVARLRARGLYAGQHVAGVTDEICVSTCPPQDGLCLGIHEVVGDTQGMNSKWGWGTIEKSDGLWRVKGTGNPTPSPKPSAPPTPKPSPSASPGGGHGGGPGPVKLGIKITPGSAKVGQTISVACSGDSSAKMGFASGRTQTLFWVNGRSPFTTPIPAGMKQGSYGKPFCLGWDHQGIRGDFATSVFNGGGSVRIQDAGAGSPLHRYGGSCTLILYCYVSGTDKASQAVPVPVSK